MDIEPETILPSLPVEAGAILDLAIAQSAALMRTEFYGEAATTPSQERHLRGSRAVYPPDALIHPHPAHHHQVHERRRRSRLRPRLPAADHDRLH
jgi:hypothetical protein